MNLKILFKLIVNFIIFIYYVIDLENILNIMINILKRHFLTEIYYTVLKFENCNYTRLNSTLFPRASTYCMYKLNKKVFS